MVGKIISFIFTLISVFTFVLASVKYDCLDYYKILLYTGGIVSPFFGIFTWAVSYQAKKRFKNVLNSIIMGGMFTSGIVFFLNGYFDSSTPANHQAQVIAKHTTTNKNSVTYHLTLASWRPDHQSEEITVNKDSYEKSVPKETKMNVITHSGFLGFEWVVGSFPHSE